MGLGLSSQPVVSSALAYPCKGTLAARHSFLFYQSQTGPFAAALPRFNFQGPLLPLSFHFLLHRSPLCHCFCYSLGLKKYSWNSFTGGGRGKVSSIFLQDESFLMNFNLLSNRCQLSEIYSLLRHFTSVIDGIDAIYSISIAFKTE